jgi:hypothetical protein
MFVGHLAAAFGARAVERRVPLAAAVAAAFALDLLWPFLLLLGLESVRVHPGDTAFTNLAFDSYPWSHSLALVLVWSAVAGVLSRAALHSTRVGLVVGALVLSHWVLDLITHRPDLPLWPSGPLVGWGLWQSIAATILVEGTLLALGLAAYLRATTARDRTGVWALAGLVALATTIWITQPWSPPPPSSTAVALGALALWLFPPWARWIDMHRREL